VILGSVPRTLPISGFDLEYVFLLRDLSDAQRINQGKIISFNSVCSAVSLSEMFYDSC
jgi:hypothetical protein